MPRKSKRQLELEASIPEATPDKNYLLPNELANLVNAHVDSGKHSYHELSKALNTKGWTSKRGMFIETGHLYRARAKHGTQPRRTNKPKLGTYTMAVEPKTETVDWQFVATLASSNFDTKLKREVLLKVLQ